MHEFDLTADPKDIASEIIKLPDGFDFAKTNLFGTLILGKPEERDPKRYAEIFTAAASYSKSWSWMYFSCFVEVINGERRAKGADMPFLVDRLDNITKFAIDKLPNGDNKYNLLGASFYNLGIMRRGLREYKESAQDQRRASAWYGLAGNAEKNLVCLFVAQVEEVTAAFVAGGCDEIRQAIHTLIEMRDDIQDTIQPYPAWMEGNASIHIAWAITMASFVDLERFQVWASQYSNLDSDFANWKKSHSAQWAKAALVIELCIEEDFEKAIEQAPVDLHSSSVNNASLTVQFFVASAYKRLGNEDEYRKRLTAIANHAGPDGGIPIAVAKRLLEK